MAKYILLLLSLTTWLAGCGNGNSPTAPAIEPAAKLVVTSVPVTAERELTVPEGNADQAFLLIWLVTPSHDPLDQVDGVNLVLKHGTMVYYDGKTPSHYGATLVSIQGGGKKFPARGYFTCEARDNDGKLLGVWNSLTVNPGLQRFDLEVGGSGNWTVTRLDYGQVIAAYDQGSFFGTHGGVVAE